MPNNVEKFIRNKEYEYIVTIDGGATKTQIEIFNRDGERVLINNNGELNSELIIEGSNISTDGIEKVTAVFHEAFATHELWQSNVLLQDILSRSLLIAGMAGVGNPKSINDVTKLFVDCKVRKENILLTDDPQAALDSEEHPVMVVIAGTGSIVKATAWDGKLRRAGGNGGAMLNDPGSGFYVGSLALRYVFDVDHNESEQSDFYRAIKQFAVDNFIDEQEVAFLQSMNDSTVLLQPVLNQHLLRISLIAKLTPIVFDFAFNKNNPQARLILQLNAEAIARNIIKVLNITRTRSDLKVVLIGGLFKSEYADQFKEMIQQQIRKQGYDFAINFELTRDRGFAIEYINKSKANLIAENVQQAIINLQAEPEISPTSATMQVTQRYPFPLEKLKGEISPKLNSAAQALDSQLKSVLTTEKSHPLTTGLAEKAQNDASLEEAVGACTSVDKAALEKLRNEYLKSSKFKELIAAIKTTLEKGGKIYLSGCGSSGRLAEYLEKYCRENLPEHYQDRIISVMAGGDFAVVRPVESFEDDKNGDYSLRQLKKQGFNSKQDLYIGISASGTAKFNNNAIWHLAKKIRNKKIEKHLKPWLIACNDANQLAQLKKDQYTQDKAINRDAVSPHPLVDYPNEMQCLGLDVGPCALQGSSRMQPATVTEIALCYAIEKAASNKEDGYPQSQMNLLIERVQQQDIEKKLSAIISAEAKCYESGNFIRYRTAAKNAIKVFTDLAERSPTFDIPKLENSKIPQKEYAWSTLSINETHTAQDAMFQMFGRTPIALNFDDAPNTSTEMLTGFDFSENLQQNREKLTGRQHDIMDINFDDEREELIFNYSSTQPNTEPTRVIFSVKGLDEFSKQMFLKMVLNTHSTLVMGRMGRFNGNLMTYVDIGNDKLFARAVRLITSEVTGRLQEKGLQEVAKHINIPHLGINKATQTIAMIVSDLLIQQGSSTISRDCKDSIVTAAAKVYLQRLEQDDKQLTGIKELQQGIVDNQQTLDKVNPEKREKLLTDFFRLRQRLSNNIVEATIADNHKRFGM